MLGGQEVAPGRGDIGAGIAVGLGHSPEEAAEAQHFFLTARMTHVEERMELYAERVKRGELSYIRPRRPEPPTSGATQWIAAPGDVR